MITITLDEVVSNFKTNGWSIPGDGVTVLDDAIAKLQKYPALTVNVTGYTDSTDGAAWNATLSQRRADSVKKYLLDHGIPASRIVSVEGKGPADPVGDNKTKEGRAQNRRAEVHSTAPIEVPAN